jgi:hypothetical protein
VRLDLMEDFDRQNVRVQRQQLGDDQESAAADGRGDRQHIEEQIHQIADKWTLGHAGDCPNPELREQRKQLLRGNLMNKDSSKQQRSNPQEQR